VLPAKCGDEVKADELEGHLALWERREMYALFCCENLKEGKCFDTWRGWELRIKIVFK
jgi:hypothetical protein